MKKPIAATFIAAVAFLAASAGTAAAQDQVTFEGLAWFDRNGNGTVDAGEPEAEFSCPVEVVDNSTGQYVTSGCTNGFGRYSVTVPAGPEYRLESTRSYVVTTEPVVLRKESGTFDVGLRGGTVTGQAFADLNANGAKDAGEPAVKAGKLDGYDVAQDAEGRFVIENLWLGQHRFEAADNRADGYVAIGQRETSFVISDVDQPTSIDARYAKPRGNIAVEGFAWTPSKGTWVVGEVVDAKFTIANRGEVVEQPSFTFGTWADKVLSHSDNFVRSGAGYVLKDPLQPGQSVEIAVRTEFVKPGFQAMNVFVQVSAEGEADTDDNRYIGPIIVDEA